MEEVTKTLAGLLGEPVKALEKIGGGGNSRVYRVETGSRQFAAKFYFQRTAGGRDRLDAEFGALKFLWAQKIRCVPEPLLADPQRQIAVYEFLSGREVPAENVNEGLIDQLVTFLIALNDIKASNGAEALPQAAEACFAVADIITNIRYRLSLLTETNGEGQVYEDFHDFLRARLRPSLQRWEDEARIQLGDQAYVAPLPLPCRTLSPSDFGFHNALLDDGGQLKFVDFEYFGWDDPTKMISDFLWHPRSTMQESLKQRFAVRLAESFLGVDGMTARMNAVFPLYGLKWCIILLNEFRPENLNRRRFATGNVGETSVILDTQLAKARRTLERVDQEPGFFK